MRALRHAASMLAAAAVAALMAACAGGPPPAKWQLDARRALESYRDAYLRGESRVAEQEFERARAALASTGDAGLVARAELTRCALRTASLDFDDCPGFGPIAGDAGPEARAYAAYVGGRWSEVDAGLLPPQHRAVVAAGGGEGGALRAIDDPAARLVAAGALFRVGRAAPGDIAVAVDTAGANGWRRPLLAWLGVQEKRAQAAGDAAAAAAIRRRIELVQGAAR